jgi:hypothetical protein
MVRVHQTRQNHQIARVNHPVGLPRQFVGGADSSDRTIRDEDRTAANLAFVSVERGDQRRVTNQERSDVSRTS